MKRHKNVITGLVLGVALFVQMPVFGQSLVKLQGKSLIELRQEQAIQTQSLPILPLNTSFSYHTPDIQNQPDLKQQLLQPQAAPIIYNYHNLAFFCKLEVQMEQAASFPIKFRLGDVRYVDRLEGKIDLHQVE